MSLRHGRLVGCLFLIISAQLAISPALARAASDALMAKADVAVSKANLQCTAVDAREIAQPDNAGTGTLSNFSSIGNGPADAAGGSGGGGAAGGGGGSPGSPLAGDSDSAGGAPGGAGPGAAGSGGPTGGPPNSTPLAYEVACSEGLGYVILTQPAGPSPAGQPGAGNPPTGNPPAGGPSLPSYSCLEMAESTQKSLACTLDANKDQSVGLNALITKAGIGCSLGGERGLGHNATNSFFEIACKGGDGYVLITGSPPHFDQPVDAMPCVAIDPKASVACKLTDSAPIIAALADFAAKPPNNCKVTGHRYFGHSPSGVLFEVSCEDNNGYLIRRTNAGMFDAMVNCTALPGKCILGKKPS